MVGLCFELLYVSKHALNQFTSTVAMCRRVIVTTRNELRVKVNSLVYNKDKATEALNCCCGRSVLPYKSQSAALLQSFNRIWDIVSKTSLSRTTCRFKAAKAACALVSGMSEDSK